MMPIMPQRAIIPTGNTDVGYGSTVTAADNTGSLTRIGFTFVGWNTESGRQRYGLQPRRDVLHAGLGCDALRPMGRINSYTLSYDGNGYTGGNVPVTVRVNYGAETTVSGNTGGLTRTGLYLLRLEHAGRWRRNFLQHKRHLYHGYRQRDAVCPMDG